MFILNSAVIAPQALTNQKARRSHLTVDASVGTSGVSHLIEGLNYG